MLAVDQRGSLRRMLARRDGSTPDEISDDPLRRIKRVVTEAVAPLATGLLTDPLYGYPASMDVLPPDVGVLLSREVTGYSAATGGERRSRLLDAWDPERALREGADAVKLLVYHHPEASPETRRHQSELVEAVGDACADAQLPFVLEAVTYSLNDGGEVAFARRKPDLVADAAATFSAPRFQVDVLKLEFPVNLKYAAPYHDAPFGAEATVFESADIEAACQQLDVAAEVPWVILSSGVGMDEFVEALTLANEAGASGFLCGRAVWKEVVEHGPDVDRMRRFMCEQGRARFERLLDANRAARSWKDHPHFRDTVPSDEVPVSTT